MEALLIELLDMCIFQWLRRIRQLRPANLTFHGGAEISRFMHSVGLMTMTRQAFDRLGRMHLILENHRASVLCATLIYGMGQWPL